MTLSFDLETWFKDNARPLPKSTLLVNYEQDRVKGREDMPLSRDLRQTDERMDGRRKGRTDRRTD